MIMSSSLTSNNSYFEDFIVGERIRHTRAKTVTNLENVLLTNLVMNTADAHFNEHRMQSHPLGTVIVYGGVTASIVIGLASQDTSDNAIAEYGLRNMKLMSPVVHGTTLHAFSEVMKKEDVDGTSGLVTFHHWGVDENGAVVFEADRTVKIRKKTEPLGREAEQVREKEKVR